MGYFPSGHISISINLSLTITGKSSNFDKLKYLLDRLEKEVEPYDKLSAFVLTVVFGWLLAPSLPHDAMLRSIVIGERIYWLIGSILTIFDATKLPVLYADHKKHKISNSKYKPLNGGICMCDLSQLRYHMRRLEKSRHEGERIKQGKLLTYSKLTRQD